MRGSWRPNRTAIYWPLLLWPSALSLSRSPGLLNRRPGAPICWVVAFSTTSCHQRVWSPNSIGGPQGPFCWVMAFSTTSYLQLLWSTTDWLPVFTKLYNSSIAHSISILMASHFRRLWTGMFDHHQAEITVMQFRGHSLLVHQSMSVPWDFTLSQFVSQARLRDFFS